MQTSRVAVNQNDDVYITGVFSGVITLGTGQKQQTLASAGYRDVLVVKFNKNGELVWAKRFGGANVARANGIAIGPTGSVFITGSFVDTISIGSILESNGGKDVFVSELSGEDGSPIGSMRLGDVRDQDANAIVVSPSGGIFITGTYSGDIPECPTILPSIGDDYDMYTANIVSIAPPVIGWCHGVGDDKNDIGVDITLGTADTVLVSGYSDKTIYMSDLPTDGSSPNEQMFSSASNNSAGGIAVLDAETVFITGGFTGDLQIGSSLTSHGDMDVFVARRGVNGMSSIRLGGMAFDVGTDITAGKGSTVALTGLFGGELVLGECTFQANGQDAFVATLGLDLDVLSGVQVGGAGNQVISSVAVDSEGHTLITGYFTDALEIGEETVPGDGGAEVHTSFVTKLLPKMTP